MNVVAFTSRRMARGRAHSPLPCAIEEDRSSYGKAIIVGKLRQATSNKSR
jgi:hypothetical protein